MDNVEQFLKEVKKENCEIVEAIRIKINNYSDLVLSGDDEIELVNFTSDISGYDKPAINLGEHDMWYWIAPLDTLVAEKCSDEDFETTEDYVSVEDLKKLLKDGK